MFIKHDYKPGQLLEMNKKAEEECMKRLDTLLKIPSNEKSFNNTIESYEQILADYGDTLSHLTFMLHVSTNPETRKESSQIEEESSKFISELAARKDIYNAVMDYVDNNMKSEELDHVQKRLVELTIRGFKQNGLHLPDDKLNEIKKINTRLGELAAKFDSNINENKDAIELTKEETEGLPDSFIERLETKDGKYVVPMKTTFYRPLMMNAKKPDVRKRAFMVYMNKESERNTKLLGEALKLRHEKAQLLGYKTHADYETEYEMAKSERNVRDFLDNLKIKLRPKYESESQKLSDLKEKEEGTARIEPWDIDYYMDKLQKAEYDIDQEELKEYFPLDVVTKAMFGIYSKLLGVTFHEIENAGAWHKDVKLYEIRDNEKIISYFYMDLYPREGKYSHAAAFTLTGGRVLNGEYNKPIASIVANFTAPTKTRPSLLSHDEVTTYFHEFGHIMHQTLTKARYSSISGTHTNRDFVEAPSQMLENWCWKEEILPMISSHYKDGKAIPDDMIRRLNDSRTFNAGYFWLRQTVLATLDLRYHSTHYDKDTIQTYKETYEEILGIEIPPVAFPAAFGHLMHGYDAKYYGYVWSRVFAQDMFTLFEKEGLLSEKIGMHYRKGILEPGYTQESDIMLRNFLGREPSEKAFLEDMGISS